MRAKRNQKGYYIYKKTIPNPAITSHHKPSNQKSRGKFKPFTLLEFLFRLLRFVFFIVRILNRQAPNVEVVTDRGYNVILFQLSLARFEFHHPIHPIFKTPSQKSREREDKNSPRNFHRPQTPDPYTGIQTQFGTSHSPTHLAIRRLLALSCRRPLGLTVA